MVLEVVLEVVLKVLEMVLEVLEAPLVSLLKGGKLSLGRDEAQLYKAIVQLCMWDSAHRVGPVLSKT